LRAGVTEKQRSDRVFQWSLLVEEIPMNTKLTFNLSISLIISLAFLLVIMTLAAIRFAMPPKDEVLLGNLEEYPPANQPYLVQLKNRATFLVNTGDELIVFYEKTPNSTRCRYRWIDSSTFSWISDNVQQGGLFIDPCLGTKFSLDGSYLDGPLAGDLERYQTRITDGQIWVDVNSTIQDELRPID
jgi:nitrite reductase/ring-hydroxylating ferredoxin subunit